jgi:CheY-like chemotaxis protein
MLKVAIENLGHQVFEAPTGEIALGAVEQFDPEVALVDIGLPVMDGFEVARRLRAMRGPSLRLIAITGYGDKNTRAKAEAVGFDLFLIKPLNISRLGDVLAP